MNKPHVTTSYNDLPCDRCGSKKIISSVWTEELKTSFGATAVEVSQLICTNEECQKEFDAARKIEVEKINERKILKEEQLRVRKENIAKNIAERKLQASKLDKN